MPTGSKDAEKCYVIQQLLGAVWTVFIITWSRKWWNLLENLNCQDDEEQRNQDSSYSPSLQRLSTSSRLYHVFKGTLSKYLKAILFLIGWDKIFSKMIDGIVYFWWGADNSVCAFSPVWWVAVVFTSVR